MWQPAQSATIPLHRPQQLRETALSQMPSTDSPEAVLAYLSRYTHRVAISNHRLVNIDANTVALRWKGYGIKRGDRLSVMRLPTFEFFRRFLMHVLPDRFHRIRHCGAPVAEQWARKSAQDSERPDQPNQTCHTKTPGTPHIARTMPQLRRHHAYHRNLPARAKPLNPRATKETGRMMKSPSAIQPLIRRVREIAEKLALGTRRARAAARSFGYGPLCPDIRRLSLRSNAPIWRRV